MFKEQVFCHQSHRTNSQLGTVFDMTYLHQDSTGAGLGLGRRRGFFATYAGLMYNDFFSVGLQIFDSRWKDAKRSVSLQ